MTTPGSISKEQYDDILNGLIETYGGNKLFRDMIPHKMARITNPPGVLEVSGITPEMTEYLEYQANRPERRYMERLSKWGMEQNGKPEIAEVKKWFIDNPPQDAAEKKFATEYVARIEKTEKLLKPVMDWAESFFAEKEGKENE